MIEFLLTSAPALVVLVIATIVALKIAFHRPDQPTSRPDTEPKDAA